MDGKKTEIDDEIIRIIKKGGVGVFPTDTLYGLVGSAFSKEAVGRIFEIKERDGSKPLIVLVDSFSAIEKFGAEVDTGTKVFLGKAWPGKISVLLKCSDPEFEYLHRGTKELAFRIPDDDRLRSLLEKTGPLVAPSANPEGETPARTVREARAYFGDRADFYVDGGTLDSEPSTLVRVEKSGTVVLRSGAVNIF